MVKRALVIHPVMEYYAGGELACLHVCKALQEMDYEVTLATETFEPEEMERIYGMGRIMSNCQHALVPRFSPLLPRFLSFQRLLYAKGIWSMFSDVKTDIVFSTQSSPFIVSSRRVFHFIYDKSNLFAFPPGSNPLIPPFSGKASKRLQHEGQKQFKKLFWQSRYRPPSRIFAFGSRVLAELRELGYLNSSLLLPPCRNQFRPLFPKKNRVVQFARLIPDKRLEVFFEIARKIPQHEFYLVGRDSLQTRRLYPGYSKSLLRDIPSNVRYVESTLKERPELLQESKVYMYSGQEAGIVLSVVEAIGAGCIPFAPTETGAADALRTADVGFIYDSLSDAVTKVKRVLGTEYSSDDLKLISAKAEIFRPEVFETNVKALVV